MTEVFCLSPGISAGKVLWHCVQVCQDCCRVVCFCAGLGLAVSASAHQNADILM